MSGSVQTVHSSGIMPQKYQGLSLNLSGYLISLDIPKVMGILNVTPDSFYAGSRTRGEEAIRERVKKLLEEGADIIDVGGCSTRPGFEAPGCREEMERVDLGCRLIRELAPDFPISVDTYRTEVARQAIERWDVSIINDVTGGLEKEIWALAAEKRVAYVLTNNKEIESSHTTAEVITDLSKKIYELHGLGVNDLIIDPGFGFSKTLRQNFELFAHLEEIKKTGYPLLVGISRKSMIYKTLETTPEEALTGTIALDAIALEKGADILRVHDVKEARETIRLFLELKQALSQNDDLT